MAATKTGTRKLSDVARLVSQPDGIASTGWPDVSVTCRKMGIEFDRWQDGAGRLILSKRTDGLLAATIDGVGMSLPRQVGKTYLVAGLVFGLCVNTPGLLVIWSAHHARTHEETFLAMQGFAQRRQIAPYIDRVFLGSGDEEIRFANGSRILFGARERGFGRGIPGVDVLIFDEGQILSEKAMQNMLATMNTSKLGLHMYIGTPPRPEDPSETFTNMRRLALAGDLHDGVWIECGADPDCDPTDRKQWAKANPSYPHRTPVQSFQRLMRKLSSDGFLREGLGVWPADNASGVFGASWSDCEIPMPAGLPMSSFALASTFDLDRSALVGAATDGDRVHVKPLQSGPGTDWIAARALDVQRMHDVDLVIDPKGPAASLIPDLERAGVRLRVVDSKQVYDSCSGIVEAVRDKRLGQGGYPELDREVEVAKKRPVGDRWAWDRKAGIPNLEASTLALWAAGNPVEVEVSVSAYADRGVLTV